MAQHPRVASLKRLHLELDACSTCPNMQRPVVHGPPVFTKVFLLGQAPGPRGGKAGRPFAWTAGKTMFRWFEMSMGITEDEFRARIYMAAVARCFPGKASGGGDRKPDTDEIARCRTFLEREVAILQPELVLAVGTLAIGEVLGARVLGKKLDSMVGQSYRTMWHGAEMDVVPLPHPSGASPWHRIEPGKTLLSKALDLIAHHPAMHAVLSGPIRHG